MKTFILAALISVSSIACDFSNEHGDCIGIVEEENPNLKYRISTWNTVWSILGVEMIFPPVLWILSCAKCPTGKK